MKTVRLTNVYTTANSYSILYDLLKERTREQSISHHQMPDLHEHVAFVRSMPYEAWYLVCLDTGVPVGSIYLTRLREIGIFIFREHQHRGYATAALARLRAAHPGPILANVNPNNLPSLGFFRKHGGKVIQLTYELPKQPREESHGNEGKEDRTARHA